MKGKIGIVGYGYVGKAIYNLFSTKHECVIYDKYVSEYNLAVFKNGLKECSLIFVSVPTPMHEQGHADMKHMNDVIRMLNDVAPNVPVCIKSAIPVGTTKKLNKEFGERWNVSPEYIGEGSRFVAPWKYPDPREMKSHDFVIVGGPQASLILDYFASVMAVDAQYIIADPTDVELTKRFENAFLATKVTFVNEAANICEAYGRDWKNVRELWLKDSRIGRSHTAVFTGERGYGGKCLEKDMSALIHESEIVGYDPTLLKSVRSSNNKFRKMIKN